MTEYAATFECLGQQLLAIVHRSGKAADVVYVLVVGGPQYRVGSHRMFVDLARRLQRAGTPVVRFDLRGMGDSDGEFSSFRDVGPDISSALDFALAETGARSAVLFGLCDGASAIAMYLARKDPRISGAILMNPEVRSEYGEARARIRHYYAKRLIQRDFWCSLVGGRVQVVRSLLSFLGVVKSSLTNDEMPDYVQDMLDGLKSFNGRVLLTLSSRDLVSQEFKDLTRRSPGWSASIARPSVEVVDVDGDHTFSDPQSFEAACGSICSWAAARA